MQAVPLEERWFYKHADGKKGPVSADALRDLIVSGSIPHDSQVWQDGLPAWTPATEVAGLLPPNFVPPRPLPRGNRASRWKSAAVALIAVGAVGGIASIAAGRRARPAPRQPESLQERLIVIGRAASLDAMPTVIEAITAAEPAVAATAVTVAEQTLGIRYSEKDKADPRLLAEKVRKDWLTTQEQVRRRTPGKPLSP